jgi:hypothetical protein
MFEKTSRLAEKVAASVSRRGFLGALGGWAAAAALGVAGVLSGGSARAGHPCPGEGCIYACGPILRVTKCSKDCPPFNQSGCLLMECVENHEVSEGCFC